MAFRNTLYQLLDCMAQHWEGKCCISSPSALFTVVFVIQYQLNTWLTVLWSREGEDKGQNRWGRLSCKFLNMHQVVSLKLHPSEQNGSNCRPLKRDWGNQVDFGVGKTLSQQAGSRTHWEGSTACFLPLLRNASLQMLLGRVPGRATGSCPILWQLMGRLTGQPGALGKENYSQWALTCWWSPLCCLSDILSGFPPWFFAFNLSRYWNKTVHPDHFRCLIGDRDPAILLERLIQSTILSFYPQAYLCFHSEGCKIGLLSLADRAVQANNSESLPLFICITLLARDYDIHC